MLKKQLGIYMYKYRFLLLLVFIFIIILLILGVGNFLAGDRLDLCTYENKITNSIGKYRVYTLKAYANKSSAITLEDIKVEGYAGAELECISFYKGNYDDLPFMIADEKEYQDMLLLLKDYKGQKLLPLPRKEGEVEYLVFVFKITEDPAKVPGLITVTYKWGWFKRTQSFGWICEN
ncbi:hypothetical protein IMX26_07780 [Clostridium sp. 'deep sea']|uniref:hypothetical protein n=1 Tax=Clostridium sp. 'deep sea' TaxID=2779445 RepID=UPI0018968319|nr:hypothetical protein [Clostridium sp. 'deep sea']QOR36696.1 hypothetical protein IMX26_07780 [Clostridium sp. 'deep sea']